MVSTHPRTRAARRPIVVLGAFLAALLTGLLAGAAPHARAAVLGDAAVAVRVSATTDFGDTVLLSGSAPELGGWNPAQAVALTTGAGSYPAWTATVHLSPGATVQYKYLKRSAAGVLTWEDGANRTLTVSPDGQVALDDQWGVRTTAPVTVTFHATAQTQSLYVVGDRPELGGWDPAEAVPLGNTASTYPVWTGTVQLPPGATVQYKYLTKSPDGVVTWEGGTNRTAVTPPTGTLTLTDAWH
ncbi:carbohydrate-binding module family 20 domain-containing protein [Kitasatospora sp. NPDC001540]|uniref:carbohydrate-binding module family 20 domain-containing protein n=1 Tax=Kitasatospora sp. NPDC001540 TaxID=3364014 RepID=UPI0036890D6D